MMQVVWSADSKVQRTVELLTGAGLLLAAGPFGLRALSPPSDTVEGLIAGLVRGGFRLGRQPLCVECGQPAEQLCQKCVEGSGPSDRVGEDDKWGRRPGRFLGVVR